MPYPFYDKEFEFTQPDGTLIKVRGWGNQNHAVFETLDGFTIIKDPLTGYYQYAKLSDDMNYLEPTGVKVGLVKPETLGLTKHLRVSKEVAKELSLSAYSQMGARSRWMERRERARSAQMRALMAPGIFAAPPSEKRTGEYIGLCILIQFPDVPGTVPQSEVENFCNIEGYNGFGNNGSVCDYFLDVSKGRLKYTNVVTHYYTAKNPRAYYTDPNVQYGTRARQLIEEALSDLKAKGFDFQQLSVDDEGYVYALNAFYAGACINDWGDGLWPHSYNLARPFDVGGGKKLYDYQITDMGSELTLATFCHENGHMICDFPDLYDYGDQSNGVGIYCLMCYGGPDEKNPTQICAYLRYKAGWADQLTPLSEGLYKAKSDINDFFLMAKSPVEYFIIENRRKAGRDRSLPASGLAIWHVDELGSNEYEEMAPSRHYECSIEQADRRFDLERRRNIGDTGDLFYAPGSISFGDSTEPNSKWWDGTSSELDLQEIGMPGSEMSFRLVKKGGGGTYQGSSSPGKAIPDRDPSGLRDAIIFNEEATVRSIKVGVDITHTYRGDLRVTLISPSGSQAVLHDRMGGSADNLKTTYDISTTPDLRNLINQPLKGEWTLWVQDVAASDRGTLNSWSLEIEGVKEIIVEMEDLSSERIPDNDPAGIVRSITVDSAGNAKNVEVSVDITHTFIGDLEVTLISPQGTSITLHKRSGGSADNIIKTYTIATTPDLGNLNGEPINGDWHLKVADLAGRDVGKLNRWALKITLA